MTPITAKTSSSTSKDACTAENRRFAMVVRIVEIFRCFVHCLNAHQHKHGGSELADKINVA